MRETIVGMAMPVPLSLAEGCVADRLSQRLAAVLADLDGHPARFVQVSWRPSWRDAGEDWKAAEAREAAEDLAALAWTAAGEDQSPGIDDFEETT